LKPELSNITALGSAAVMVGLAYLHTRRSGDAGRRRRRPHRHARDHGRKLVYLKASASNGAADRRRRQWTSQSAEESHPHAAPRRTQEKELIETWFQRDAARFTALLDGYFKDRPEAKGFSRRSPQTAIGSIH